MLEGPLLGTKGGGAQARGGIFGQTGRSGGRAGQGRGLVQNQRLRTNNAATVQEARPTEQFIRDVKSDDQITFGSGGKYSVEEFMGDGAMGVFADSKETVELHGKKMNAEDLYDSLRVNWEKPAPPQPDRSLADDVKDLLNLPLTFTPFAVG